MLSSLFRRKSVQRILEESEQGRMEAQFGGSLRRTLRAVDLAAFGVAAIIGVGVFSTIGQAAHSGGPAVALLFVFIAVACGFTAFCYSEFASMIPISGSAYTYAYASFGEIIAWIIGWDLLLEYAIGNIAVAISWSDYFTGFLSGLGIRVPEYLTMDFLTASRGYSKVQELLSQGQSLTQIFSEQSLLKDAYTAWTSAPVIGPLHVIADVPALLITAIISVLIYIGIKESRNANNLMVAVKLLVVIAVIAIGIFYVQPANWSPFMPNGLTGVLQGVAAVFFAFIGFDAISTTAEECHDPQRDMPKGIFYSLVICTILYVLIAFVLTGIVNFKELNVGDPLAFIFKDRLPWLSGVIAFTAVFVIASVFLVFQLGQPRIWMSMSRDGLLPRVFSRIHPKYKTPSFSTVVAGLLVAVPALFMNLTEVVDLSSIGTLFAFVLVCGGVLVLENSKNPPARPKFKTPYLNGRYIVPVLYAAAMYWCFKSDWRGPLMILFVLVSTIVTLLTIICRLSLIPVLGLLTSFFLMTQLGATNWARFGIWLVVGLVIYFLYGRKRSRLNALR
ncbi:MAG TPA: amino acid permease [Verrucomicrobiae bacterium]|nr:amino acid permease [Verrucomicrobiae bacterium]